MTNFCVLIGLECKLFYSQCTWGVKRWRRKSIFFIWSYFHIVEKQIRFVQVINKIGYQYCACVLRFNDVEVLYLCLQVQVLV